MIFSIKALMEEIKPAVTERRNQVSRFNNIDSTFRNFWTFRSGKHVTKSPTFWWTILVHVWGFWLRPWWKIWSLYSWRRNCWKMKEIENYLRYLIFLQSGDHRTTCSSTCVFGVVFLNLEKPGSWTKGIHGICKNLGFLVPKVTF